MTIHVFTAPVQSATRFRGEPGVRGRWMTLPPRAHVWTSCCHRIRHAGTCTTQVYDDVQRFWCDAGKGCKRPSRRRRVTRRVLLRLFAEGVSTRALARRYGQPRTEIEQRLRRGA